MTSRAPATGPSLSFSGLTMLPLRTTLSTIIAEPGRLMLAARSKYGQLFSLSASMKVNPEQGTLPTDHLRFDLRQRLQRWADDDLYLIANPRPFDVFAGNPRVFRIDLQTGDADPGVQGRNPDGRVASEEADLENVLYVPNATLEGQILAERRVGRIIRHPAAPDVFESRVQSGCVGTRGRMKMRDAVRIDAGPAIIVFIVVVDKDILGRHGCDGGQRV
ncbi:hypothetical protein VTN96DRAFT_4872 [Rasamsonia emersonii]